MKALFLISLFFILWHNLFYGILLIVVSFLSKRKPALATKNEKIPKVSLIVAAHNEERVIENKILNSLALKYPEDKLEIIFASDSSIDRTNYLISKYSALHKNIKLLEIMKRGGKLNAYNEAIKIAKGEIIAFSDANTTWDANALEELIKSFTDESIACACGKLIYTNTGESGIAYLEGLYWEVESMIKKGESQLYSLTALNGAIYAVRKKNFIFIDPLYSHDLCLPLLLGRLNKRTVFVETSLAFERSGTTIGDEIKRKRRMFGRIYSFIFHYPVLFINPFSYNLVYFFSVFSHRTIRYMLPILHTILLISSSFLYGKNVFFSFALLFQITFFAIAFITFFLKPKIKVLMLPYYYLVFLISMILGFFDFATGRIKAYWEIADSTRKIE